MEEKENDGNREEVLQLNLFVENFMRQPPERPRARGKLREIVS